MKREEMKELTEEINPKQENDDAQTVAIMQEEGTSESFNSEGEGGERGERGVRKEPGENGKAEVNPENPLKAEEEGRRMAEIDMLFGRFPKTAATLSEDKDFRVDEKMERFMANVEGFMRGSGRKESELDESLLTLLNIALSLHKGGLSLDMLDIVVKGICGGEDMEARLKEAELKGRNAAIEIALQEASATDGMPHPTTRNHSSRQGRGIFSLAEGARR